MDHVLHSHIGEKSMETALAAAHRDSRQGLPVHHLAWLQDDAPRWSLSHAKCHQAMTRI